MRRGHGRAVGFARVRKSLRSLGLATALLLAPVSAPFALANDVVVFAAASLKNALDDIAGQWKA